MTFAWRCARCGHSDTITMHRTASARAVAMAAAREHHRVHCAPMEFIRLLRRRDGRLLSWARLPIRPSTDRIA